MNLVYLSPEFPSNFHDFSRALREVGVNVLGIGETPWDNLPQRMREWLTEYYRVDSLEDYDQLLRACGHFIHRHGRIDRVDSHAEYWIQTEARLRSDFNIPGMRLEHMDWVKRKSKMKERFIAAGVPVCRGQLCDDIASALHFAKVVGYPIVAKPDIGVGAAGTFRLNSDEAVENFFRTNAPSDYFFEEYMSGTLCSFDGLVNRSGVPVFTASHVFSSGIMEVVNDKVDIYYYSEREIPADLVELGTRALQAFEVRERFFHIEFFRTAEGLRALEVNLRVPGGVTANMFCYANDVDIFRQWAQIVSHDGFDGNNDRPYHVAYVGRRNEQTYQVSDAEARQRLGELLVMHQDNEPIFSAALGNRAFIMRHPELTPLLDATRWLLR